MRLRCGYGGRQGTLFPPFHRTAKDHRLRAHGFACGPRGPVILPSHFAYQSSGALCGLPKSVHYWDTLWPQLHKPNRSFEPGRLMGDSPDTRRGYNFEPPGSAFSLRRASYYSPGLRQTGGTQLTRVLHFGEWVSDGGHSAAAELPALPVLQGSAFSISIPPGLASQYDPA